MNMAEPSRIRMVGHEHRVLLYTTCYNVLDGVTLTVRKLEEEIVEAGHHVCLLTTVSGDPANTGLVAPHPRRQLVFLDRSMPIPFVQDPNNPELTYQIGFALFPQVKAQIQAFAPTIIHITCPDCTALHLIEYARRHEIPVIGSYHSNIPEYMEHYPGLSWLKPVLAAFFRHQYNFLSALYVPTPYIKRHLTEQWQMDRVTDVQVWGHGIDTETFHPRHRSLQFRRNFGIGDKEIVVVWVSRLVPEKRPDVFMQVVQRLYAQNLPFHALVIGAGPCEAAMAALPNTTFAGWMNEEQLSVAYASCDIFLFPSAVETFGLVTLEAAASGLPVIVEANCSGHLVADGESGYACPDNDVDAYFQATLDLVVNHDKRRCFGEASRRLALAWEKRTILRKMLDNYNRAEDLFYKEYGGRHGNRDIAYTQEGSFVGGNHPRPVLLIVVEWMFTGLFRVIWNLTVVWAKVLPLVQRCRPRTTVVSKARIIELDVDLEVSPDAALLADDTTTASSVSSESTIAKKPCGDGPMVHSLAISLVRGIEWQCRLESQLRNAVARCCGKVTLPSRAPRKNSSLPAVDQVMSDLSQSEGRRMRRLPSNLA